MAQPGRPIHSGPRTFDDAKLQSMIEPLRVRVDRIKAHQRTPIPLPDSLSGGLNGEGWTLTEIRDIERMLVNDWTGGGLYEISVTDSSENPVTMKWQPYWNPAEYPEKVPPPLEGARAADAPPPTPTAYAQAQTGARMPPFPPPTPYPQPYPGYPGFQFPPPPQVGTPQFASWEAERSRREQEAELRKLRDEKEQREREVREERHRAELAAERAASNERFARLEAGFDKLASVLKDGAAKPVGPSQSELDLRRQMEEMRAENQRAREDAERARREQEADRREAALREQLRVQADEARRAYEQTQTQITAMQREFQAMITNLTTQLTNNSNKSDPLISLMLENTRQQSDMVKAIAVENRIAMEKMQANVMNPREMLALARESQQGVEQAIERTTRLTSSVLDMQNRVLQTAIEVQPQGNGVLDAVREGMGNVKEFFERYMAGKSQEAIVQTQAQVELARTQAHAYEVNARMTNPQAFAQPAGLGAPPPATSEAQPVAQASAQPQAPRRVERLWGRTDEEWFDIALGDVLKLRAGVAEFHAAIDEYERTGRAYAKISDIPGMHPADAARVIGMAIGITQQGGINIPAVTELLLNNHVTEFMALLLPTASAKYRDDVLAILQNGQEPQHQETTKQDKDSAEDEEDEDDENETRPETSPTVVAKPRPQSNRRAKPS